MTEGFFARDACEVARDLVGKVLRRRVDGGWVSVAIVETEAYYLWDRASHSSLGRTPSREPMFMAPGTLYLYRARGGDSLNVSCGGPGDAVLIKAGRPWDLAAPHLDTLHRRVPLPGGRRRADHRLCAGQTLVCRALGLQVATWTGKRFDPDRLRLDDAGYQPGRVVQTRRLGIAADRDPHLPFRFVDAAHAHSATRNPLTRRGAVQGVHYALIDPDRAVAP